MTCRSKPEETLLAPAILSIINWLLQVFHHALCKTSTTTPIINETDLLDKSGSIVNAIVGCEFMMAMCCLAKYNDIELYNETTRRCYQIETTLKAGAPTKTPVVAALESSLQDLLNLDVDTVSKNVDGVERVTYCVQGMLEVSVIHDPSAATGVLVSQMMLIKRMKGFTMARLYCEMLRACWLSLYEVSGTGFESQWGAFTFLKIPHIVSNLHNITKGPADEGQPEYSQDVVDSLEMFLEHVPLLDNLDVKCCNCNCFECMLGELAKLGLVTEKHVRYLLGKREQASGVAGQSGASAAGQGIKPVGKEGAPATGIPKVVIQAEPTLAGILKTLQTDKLQEPLLRMMYQVLNGKSFELILSVASVEGKLRSFVTRLLKFNECSKNATAELGKTAAMLFDSSFIMLCSIVQNYGSDVVLEENGDTFFEQWVRQVSRSFFFKGLLRNPDPNKSTTKNPART